MCSAALRGELLSIKTDDLWSFEEKFVWLTSEGSRTGAKLISTRAGGGGHSCMQRSYYCTGQGQLESEFAPAAKLRLSASSVDVCVSAEPQANGPL